MAIVELNDVSKHFGAKIAVDHVTFNVEEGQCYGLIGPNGAGKTTTFSMLCGFLAPTTGSLKVMGVAPSEPAALKRRLGALPQDALLPASWPVGAFLVHLAKLSNLAAPEKEAREALDRVQLPETWNIACGSMSHGMGKRVALAQAIMGKPPVICLDEPTAGLDPKIAASVRGIIRDLKGSHTVIVSSHNLQELEELCDGTAILDKGKLISAASMVEITGQMAEFRVQIADGAVPMHEIRALVGCKNAKLEPNNVLLVAFDSTLVQPEEIITKAIVSLAENKVRILGVWRGKKLEERVLQLT